MEHELIMPKLGSGMEEGTVLHWLKAEGDVLAKGDLVVEIEAEKASVEVDTMQAGTLKKILVAEGETVPVGTPIAIIEE